MLILTTLAMGLVFYVTHHGPNHSPPPPTTGTLSPLDASHASVPPVKLPFPPDPRQ
ncbi:MAG: hypothetical protein AAGF75_12475 [Cyanobacteria bacterium P01_H01_bin.130]